MEQELKIVAVVSMNGSEALVLNRPLRFLYAQEGNDFIGRDGDFSYYYKYERGGGRFVAFAGRPVSIHLENGESKTLQDHWWHHVPTGVRSVSVCSNDELRKCYVFYTANIEGDALKKLRETYTGEVFDYWDYKKALHGDTACV